MFCAMNKKNSKATIIPSGKKLIWNVPVTIASPQEIIEQVGSIARSASGQLTIACANPHSQVIASKDYELLKALQASDILLPDGIGTVLAGRLLGTGVKQRFTGPDFFRALSECMNDIDNRCSYFFLGSSKDVLDGIVSNMKKLYPHISVAGVLSPPFGEFTAEENERMIDEINRANPSVLWVGMTAPKQEKWIASNRHKLMAPVIAAIGAEFDYFAGTKSRPPVWMQKAGLQWLHRFLTEPGRTWQRHIVSMPLFVGKVLKLWLRNLLDRSRTDG